MVQMERVVGVGGAYKRSVNINKKVRSDRKEGRRKKKEEKE